MEPSNEHNPPASSPLAAVLGAQHTAFGVIFSMFEDLKESNRDLEERVTTMGLERAKDALKINELTEELKVREDPQTRRYFCAVQSLGFSTI